MSSPTARVNLVIPIETMIQVEKECDKRGINRIQFIREAIHDKLKHFHEKSNKQSELRDLKDEINELKKIILLMYDK